MRLSNFGIRTRLMLIAGVPLTAFDAWAFDPETARWIVRCLEFRHKPKHGSWLNIAENELSSMTRQCIKDRRFATVEALQSETTAWHDRSNAKQRGVDW